MPRLVAVASALAHDARRLYGATPKAERALTILDDSRHGTALVAGNAEARRRIQSFLRSHRA